MIGQSLGHCCMEEQLGAGGAELPLCLLTTHQYSKSFVLKVAVTRKDVMDLETFQEVHREAVGQAVALVGAFPVQSQGGGKVVHARFDDGHAIVRDDPPDGASRGFDHLLPADGEEVQDHQHRKARGDGRRSNALGRLFCYLCPLIGGVDDSHQ